MFRHLAIQRFEMAQADAVKNEGSIKAMLTPCRTLKS
jgi:hypothetical protein